MKEILFDIESYSPSDTLLFAEKLAKEVKPGDVYTLNGDLGVGKTVFTQGFAKGLLIDDVVCSPTFTIVQEYNEGRIPLYHFDVYRIGDSSEMEETGFDDYISGEGVCLIEWAELISDILPDEYYSVVITKDLSKGFDFRKITVTKITDGDIL